MKKTKLQQKCDSSEGRPSERKFQWRKIELGEDISLGLEIDTGDMKKTKIK